MDMLLAITPIPTKGLRDFLFLYLSPKYAIQQKIIGNGKIDNVLTIAPTSIKVLTDFYKF